VVIVVGCGKSSLLLAILGELSARPVSIKPVPNAPGATTGEEYDEDAQLPAVAVLDPSRRGKDDGPVPPRRVGYVGQDPFVARGSVRANVTFGERFEPGLYGACLAACQLVEDLEAWPRGDLTPVGEHGVALSGGQRARLALARCCYLALCRDDVHLVLLDDPLSAVGPEVLILFVCVCFV
jgi:ABC-type transport system involved in cytochrome bd biosynthesis fused ATPase/permease subunit